MSEHIPQKPKQDFMQRPFKDVVDAILFTLPNSNKNKPQLDDILTRIIIEEPDKNRQWRMLASALQDYMTGSHPELKQRIIHILRDPTEYRYVLKEKEKKEIEQQTFGMKEDEA